MRNANAAVLLIAMLCRPVFGQQTSVAGVVLDSVTHHPLAGVHITLRPAPNADDEQPASAWGAVSKQDGSFSIRSVPPGFYTLSAKRNGYVQLVSLPVHGVSEAVRGPSTLALKAGEDAADVRLELTSEAVVTGHVFDENGDPLQHFFIEAESAGTLGGRTGGAQTDERGQFRLVLWPGRFYLKAAPIRAPIMQPTEEGNLAEPVYLATYHPASASRASATVIDVAPDQHATDIDFHLTPARILRISGTVSGAPDRGRGTVVVIDGRGSFPTTPDGKFTVAGLPPGEYQLSARYEGEPKPTQSQIVDVRLENADETDVLLTLAPAEAISGTVEIAGGSPKSAGPGKLNIQLSRLGNYGGNPLKATVDSEGRFRIDNVFPGKFQMRVLPLPENAYVKSMKVDNAEATDGVFDFSRGVNHASLRVIVSLGGATLEGFVVGSDGKPAANRGVVFLETAAERIDFDHLKHPGPDGGFRFTGLQPGKYRLIAVDLRLASAGSAILKPLFDAAPEFEIHERHRIRKDAEIALPPAENATP